MSRAARWGVVAVVAGLASVGLVVMAAAFTLEAPGLIRNLAFSVGVLVWGAAWSLGCVLEEAS